VSKDPLSYHTKTCDYWSAGIFLYELLVGATPFTAPNGSKRVELITGQILRAAPRFPASLRPLSRSFLSALLQKDPRARLGAQGGLAQISARGLAQISAHAYFEGLSFPDVEAKRYAAPLKISLRSEADTRYFNRDFLRMPTDHTETDFPEQRKYLKNYSWVSPEHFGELVPKNLNRAIHKDEKFFSQYKMDVFAAPLGVGARSVVRACTHLVSGEDFAVKMVPRASEADEEVDALIALQGHPCVLELHEVIRDEMYTYIVTEHIQGQTLDQLLRSQAPLCERQLWSLFAQLLDAVRHVHSCKLLHGDLRLDNVMTTKSDEEFPKIKLIDFGFARRTDASVFDPVEKFSLRYMSPETLNRFKNNSPYRVDEGTASEVWCLGVMLYKLTFNVYPFVSSGVQALDELGDDHFRWGFPEGVRSITKELRAVIEGMLVHSIRHRSRLEDLIQSPWMTAQRYFPSGEDPKDGSDLESLLLGDYPSDSNQYTNSETDYNGNVHNYYFDSSTNLHNSYYSESKSHSGHGYLTPQAYNLHCNVYTSSEDQAAFNPSEDLALECSAKRRLDSESSRIGRVGFAPELKRRKAPKGQL